MSIYGILKFKEVTPAYKTIWLYMKTIKHYRITYKYLKQTIILLEVGCFRDKNGVWSPIFS